MKHTAAIFDLDGVLVDTAKFHYLAWRDIAARLGLDFTLEQNEALKGVSRMGSLDIIVRLSGKTVPLEQRELLAAEKNEKYVALTETLTESDCLPGAKEFLQTLRQAGIPTALGSASRNALPVLDRLGITSLFDVIIDGTKVQHPKPDPEVFLRGAQELRVPVSECVVFEDAAAGIRAAKTAGMYTVGIGDPKVLSMADMVIPHLDTSIIPSLFL